MCNGGRRKIGFKVWINVLSEFSWRCAMNRVRLVYCDMLVWCNMFSLIHMVRIISRGLRVRP